MCSYVTQQAAIRGAAKGSAGWFPVTGAVVSVDHPYFSSESHTLNLDFRNQALGPSARVAVELHPADARRLVACIEAALADFESA